MNAILCTMEWLDGVPLGWAILGSFGAAMVVTGTIIYMREHKRRLG